MLPSFFCTSVRRLTSKMDKGLMILGMSLIIAGLAEFAVGYGNIGECGNPITYPFDLEAASRECDLSLTLVFCGIMTAVGGVVSSVLGTVGIGRRIMDLTPR